MQTSLALTALIMGLAGGPHCVAMCGAACAGIGQLAGQQQNRALFSFQVGRWLGYTLMGALAAFGVQALGWLTVESAALRPVWSMLHVAAVVLGLLLVWQTKQPVWLDQSAQRLWSQVRKLNANLGKVVPVAVGALWALMPCGLLYSALMVAALTGNVWEGALTMACFALGSGVSLGFAPWLLLKLKTLGDGAWGIRLAGLALAVTSGWGLWLGLAHNQAPWCIT
jgi:sulfite exporter TauE/SafE